MWHSLEDPAGGRAQNQLSDACGPGEDEGKHKDPSWKPDGV